MAAESIVITPLSQSKTTAEESADTSDGTEADAGSEEQTEQDTGTADESDSTAGEDTETSAAAEDASTINTEGIYD